MKIIKHPTPSLLEPSRPVEFNEGLSDFITELLGIYKQARREFGPGVVGLAAPQVGNNIRVFIAFGEIYINPEVLWTPKETNSELEGCLSLPLTEFFDISRPYGVKIKYQNQSGDWKEKRFNDMNARVILHELDHLEGKLCCGENYDTTKP